MPMNQDSPTAIFVDSATTFVDYTPPPSPKPSPPAKYKLWLLILVIIFFESWLSGVGAYAKAIADGSYGWITPAMATFASLAISVFVAVFSTLDLVVTLFTVKIKGGTYGLGPWMKRSRATWVHRREDFPSECLSCLVRILEDGFGMFHAPRTPPNKEEEDKRRDEGPEFTCPSEDCHVTLKVQHRTCPTKSNEYSRWRHKMDTAVARYALGQVDMTRHEMDVIREEGGSESGWGGQDRTIELHTIYVTFENLDRLNEWMASDTRRGLVRKLEPLLAAPNVLQVQSGRILADAFTDLLVRQGEFVPSALPKKWKVWWLTTLGLFVVVLQTQPVLSYYFDVWGLDKSPPILRVFVTVTFNTFLNSYVMTPLLMFFFSDWVRRKENENDTRQPWRTLNDGFESVLTKAAITMTLYGFYVLMWVMRD